MTVSKPVLGGNDSVKVCAAQLSPVLMDQDATLARALSAIEEAATAGARLIAFPEVYLAGYPYWTEGWDTPLPDWAQVRQRFFDAAVLAPSAVTEAIGAAARAGDIYVAMGCNEVDPRPGVHTIYNSMLFFDRDGTLRGRHRKLLPTFSEKLFWGAGRSEDLAVFDTDIGRIGTLICGENLVTPLRAAMIAMGEDFHIAVFPGAFSLHTGPRIEEWDAGHEFFWGHATTRSHSLEAGCFTISVCAVLNEDDVADDFPFKGRMNIDYSRGGSAVIAPVGVPLVGPVEGATLVYADCEAWMIKCAKAIADTVGHYGRDDVARVQLRTDAGWRTAGQPYQSGHAVRVDAAALRRAADLHEVDEDKVAAQADEQGLL